MVEPKVSSSFALFYDSPVLTRDIPSGSLCLGTSFVVTSLLSASFSEAVLRVCVGWFDLMALS